MGALYIHKETSMVKVGFKSVLPHLILNLLLFAVLNMGFTVQASFIFQELFCNTYFVFVHRVSDGGLTEVLF